MTGGVAGSSASTTPVLATPEQVEADRLFFRLVDDPQIAAIKAKVKADLLATEAGGRPDGASRLDEALDQFTASVIFKEIGTLQADPGMIILVDNTPRDWLGYTVPGIGMAGDNPDNVNRVIVLDGSAVYELNGKFDPARKPASFVIQIAEGDGSSTTPTKKNAMGTDRVILSTLTEKSLVVEPDGAFKIIIGGPPVGPNHLSTTDGVVVMNTRDSMPDWAQRPARIELRRLDGAAPPPLDLADLRARVITKLEPFLRYWGGFNETWFGGIKPNTISPVVGRDGAFGFAAGLRFRLAPDEAVVVTTSSGGSSYTGFQATDLWLIGPDARRCQNSLNLFQATPDADGRFTYVLGPTDPGLANWVDTFGLHEGFAVIRWQGCGPNVAAGDLLHDFKIVKLADAKGLPGVAPITPEARRAQIAKRASEYEIRFQ